MSAPMASQARHYDLLLLGNSGHGKSATGNSILGRRAFVTSSAVASTTVAVQAGWSDREDCVVKVVDGPGIGDTRLNEHQAVENAISNMARAMMMCTRGFHAIVIVYKFGRKFGLEERESMKLLKDIFGPDLFRKYTICVLTHGDQFEGAMEEENTPEKTPLDWCMEQESSFAEWLQECGSRVLLFDNRSKDPNTKHQQVEQLLQLVEALPNGGVRYSNAQFVAMHEEQQRLILKFNLPQMEEDVRKKCSLLKESLERINLDSPNALQGVADLKRRANKLIRQIEEKDRGTNVLMPLKSIVDSILLIAEQFEVTRHRRNETQLQQQIGGLQRQLQSQTATYSAELARLQQKKEVTTFCEAFVALCKVLCGCCFKSQNSNAQRTETRSTGGVCLFGSRNRPKLA